MRLEESLYELWCHYRTAQEECEPRDAYELTDPKSPGFHERMADLWDNRDKTEER